MPVASPREREHQAEIGANQSPLPGRCRRLWSVFGTSDREHGLDRRNSLERRGVDMERRGVCHALYLAALPLSLKEGPLWRRRDRARVLRPRMHVYYGEKQTWEPSGLAFP
jgi:hypothetical protein